MAVVGKITAVVDFKSLKYVLREAKVNKTGKVIAAEASTRYGELITVFIEFILVSFVMFLLVKAINKMKKKQDAIPAALPPLTAEQKLLT